MATIPPLRVQIRTIPGLAVVSRACLAFRLTSALVWSLEHWPFWIKVGNQPWERVN